jgi:hypothetical protein
MAGAWMPFRLRACALAAGLACALPVAAADGPARQIAVDLELVLAVDVSMSMMVEELAIQRNGYAAALSDSDVVAAILGGPRRRIAITYFEWAGVNEQTVVIPWTIVESVDDVRALGERLVGAPEYRSFRTSVSGALEFAATLFDGNGIEGAARIIDISGDGANNEGLPVSHVRDATIARGVTINGLPLMTDFGLISSFDVANLDDYYAECVIGGPGAFSEPVENWEQFAGAVRRKLVREITQLPQRDDPAPIERAAAESGYDCLIGEKLWNRQQGIGQ